jgi:flagellin
MIINHNLNAMNAHRQLGIGNAAASKSMEKLSSGYRINRAGDDAAGLAISEKMRGQIRGLTQASRNAQDGISLIQTAEGALNETHAILQRMRELAVQASNDTNINVDRSEIQKEMNELIDEIDRIATTTQFNQQDLLTGKFEGKFHIGANQGQDITLSIANMASGASQTLTGVDVTNMTGGEAEGVATAAQVTVTLGGEQPAEDQTIVIDGKTLTFKTTVGADSDSEVTIGGTLAETIANVRVALGGETDNYTVSGSGNTIVLTQKTAAADPEPVPNATGTWIDSGSGTASSEITRNYEAAPSAEAAEGTIEIGADTELAAGTVFTIGDKSYELVGEGGSAADGNIAVDISSAEDNEAILTALDVAIQGDRPTGVDTVVVNAGAGTITVTAVAGAAGNDIELNVTAGTVEGGLGLGDLKVAGVTKESQGGIMTQTGASGAITTIQTAIETVSAERSKLGAYQNRLEHTIKNLDNSAENLQAAESRIRDVDMAKEMMEFTKNNILQQAAQAMLAQANQAPQGVLQLLR